MLSLFQAVNDRTEEFDFWLDVWINDYYSL